MSDSSWSHVMNHNTRTLEPFVEPQAEAEAADLRLFRVGATDEDGEFYVRCSDASAAADVVVQRASLKKHQLVYRPIAEVAP